MMTLQQKALVLGVFGADGLNPAYQAVLTEAASEGDTPPVAAAQTAGSNLITSLQDAGLWADIGAKWVYQHPSTDQESFSFINWKDPANYRRTKVNGVTFGAKTGWKGDAVNGALASGLNVDSAGFNKGFFYYIRTWPTVFNNYLFGTNGNTYGRFTGATDYRAKMRSTAEFTKSPYTPVTGLHCWVRDGGNIILYVNGAVVQTSAIAENSTSGTNLADLAYSATGVAASDAEILIAGCFSAVPSAAEIATLNTHIGTYKTAIDAL